MGAGVGRFEVAVSDKWLPSWPYPQKPGPIVFLDVEPDGTIDASGMLESLEQMPYGSDGYRWCLCLKAIGIRAEEFLRCSPAKLLDRVCRSAMVECIVRQLLVSTAKVLQVLFSKQGASQNKKLKSRVLFQWSSLLLTPSGKEANMLCAQYVIAAKDSVPQPTVLGVATDKAWVHGLPLQMSSLTYVNNFYQVCTPAVASGGGSQC